MLSKRLSIFFVFIMLAGFPPAGAWAQPVSGVKAYVGVLDMKKIMSELIVVKDLNAQAQKVEDSYRADFSAREKKLREEKLQIERQKALLTPSAYSDKQVAFNKKAAAYRLEVQDKVRQVQEGRAKALNEIRAQMLPIVREIMDKHGATFVLDVSEVLFVEKELNLTADVTEALNKKLKKVKFEIAPLKKS